jgi:cytolysin-activating lysine-acyltransferase
LKNSLRSQDYAKSVLDGLCLFGLSEYHCNYTLLKFSYYFIFALQNNKARLFYEHGEPVGTYTWCLLSHEKSKAFAKDDYLIEEEDYKAEIGDQFWGVEFIAPFGHAKQMMKDGRDMIHNRYPEHRGQAIHWKRNWGKIFSNTLVARSAV